MQVNSNIQVITPLEPRPAPASSLRVAPKPLPALPQDHYQPAPLSPPAQDDVMDGGKALAGLAVPAGIITSFKAATTMGLTAGVTLAGAGILAGQLSSSSLSDDARATTAVGGMLSIGAAAATAYLGKGGMAAAAVGGLGALLTYGAAQAASEAP
ncbi:hypothetical protein COW36_18115 [bacterium (Candidatus Blackallbacteria) CG17_big_fil_post_rev_8_21_14_2_50_48_46]|uniref:Uncharacterized protein n=1 Tax=bacterium (Candidatus Blackallbacteria) CG17_big_fil_post_rev_8_21_14_2_50_48_46 TaxID=2014261 RepID=A0A2M7G0V1_9BACT|nr:MAG: hypothetical protein COW64_00615 [bacterium (Candidatus Blackallbacteria) CG18_big_fil_WC_8_21_14_2_50_49_26]PIW15331.1 MAG: hypothetical protein COW36_18115 [bacterium (Candidatus Blackallbacteria) CG17_big_fil_post_rev_8_21_14_2_50_48_46]PIW49808.1 MAG: hypothetical protein COW20_05250 [bacterium (Candidatus Blackallbacteria) CG13_big_fil_rev_8_21_14_2_50_49_14]